MSDVHHETGGWARLMGVAEYVDFADKFNCLLYIHEKQAYRTDQTVSHQLTRECDGGGGGGGVFKVTRCQGI